MDDDAHTAPATDIDPLESSAERFELIARGSHDGIWDLDLHTGALYVSERWIEVAGTADTPHSMQEWLDLVHPDDRSLLREAVEAHLAGTTSHLEVEVRVGSGITDVRWILLRGLADDQDPRRRLAGSITDTTATHHAEVRLRHQALHDPLTGLPNRTFLMEELNRHHARERRDPSARVALLFLDLVGFKTVNDLFGHDAGDEILRVIGRRLRFATRPTDLPARLGGDEFVVTMSDLAGPADALQVAERLVEVLRQPIPIHGHDHQIIPSAGLVMSSDERWSPESLLREADTAMYRAKRLGSTAVELHVLVTAPGPPAEPDSRSLEGAARHGRLLMHYQPMVDPLNGLVQGYEALLRWRRPGRGVVSAFTEAGQMDPRLDRQLSHWALERSIDETAAALRSGAVIPMLAVNISRTHLVDPGLAADIESLLTRNDVPPEWLRVEVNADELDGLDLSVLDPLRRMGIGIHLDGFGVLDASLRLIHDVNPLALKIDPRVTAAMLDDISILRLIRSICAASTASDILIVACGIELPASNRVIRDLGASMAQGSLFGAPEASHVAFRPVSATMTTTSVAQRML